MRLFMTNFESKSLKKKFDKIVFGSLAGAGASAAGAGGDMAALHSGVAKAADVGNIKVAKATGPDARTVAEIVTTKDQAKIGDVVVVKGVVHTDRDLGSGYSYKVLIEEATLQK